MKLFALLALIALAPMAAEAKGTLTVSGNYYKKEKDFRPSVGLAVYEKLVPGVLAYNSWTGVGEGYYDRGFQWITTKQSLEGYIGKVTVAAGFQLEYGKEDKKVHDSLFLKVGYRLWD